MPAAEANRLTDLRQQIERIEGVTQRARSVLPFGVHEIDRNLRKGGLAFGALHEIAGGANGAVDGAAAVSFAAGIAARTGGTVLWCHCQPDLFAPALAQSGLTADRVVFFEAPDETAILDGLEKALRHGGLTAVVGEVSGLPLVASQRLQMAAEATGTMALVVRRWHRHVDARDFGNSTASFTRWRVTPVNSTALPVRGVGRSRWYMEQMRTRGGKDFECEVEACDGKGFIAVPSLLADRPVETEDGRYRAVS